MPSTRGLSRNGGATLKKSPDHFLIIKLIIMKQKSKGVYVSHLKAIKRKATLKVVLQALYWFMVGVAGVLLGQLLVLIF